MSYRKTGVGPNVLIPAPDHPCHSLSITWSECQGPPDVPCWAQGCWNLRHSVFSGSEPLGSQVMFVKNCPLNCDEIPLAVHLHCLWSSPPRCGRPAAAQAARGGSPELLSPRQRWQSLPSHLPHDCSLGFYLQHGRGKNERNGPLP